MSPRVTKAGEPKHGPHAPRVPFAVLVISLIVGGLALLLALNTASAANEIRRRDITAKDASVAAQLQVARNQVAASAASNNLARAARGLGMVQGKKPAFLIVGTDGTIRLGGKPGAVTGVPVAAPPTTKAKPTTTASPTRTPTSTATTSKSASSSKSTSKSKSTLASRSSARSTPVRPSSSRTTPKPTPTPTVTLPGGDR